MGAAPGSWLKYTTVVSVTVLKKFREICYRTGDHLYDGMGVNGKISIDICALFNVAFDDPIIDCCQVTLNKINGYGLYEND